MKAAAIELGRDGIRVNCVCFLLGDSSRRITGVEIAVDAGGTAGRLLPGLPGF